MCRVIRRYGQYERLAPHDSGLEWQHYPKLGQKASDAVDRGGALLDKSLTGTVHHELALLIQCFDRNKAHVGASNCFADGSGICCIVLASLAGESVRSHELGSHQAHSMSKGGKQSGPVVGAGAGFHTNQTRGQRGNKLCQLDAWHARPQQHWFACCIDTMNGKDIFCQINSNRYDSHDFPSRTS